MCLLTDSIDAAYQQYQDELVAAGLLVPFGVPGVYGQSGVFEMVIEQFEHYVTRMVAHLEPEAGGVPARIVIRQGRGRPRHCERSEAIQGNVGRRHGLWIATSLRFSR